MKIKVKPEVHDLVFDFVMELHKHINKKARKAITKDEWLYDGPAIEKKLLKLIAKIAPNN